MARAENPRFWGFYSEETVAAQRERFNTGQVSH